MGDPRKNRAAPRWSNWERRGWVRDARRLPPESIPHPRWDDARVSLTREDPGAMYPEGWDGPRVGDPCPVRRRRRKNVSAVILTAAQNQTPVHGPFWVNLRACAALNGADIRVGGLTYAKAWWEVVFRDRNAGEEHVITREDWADCIRPHVTTEMERVAPGVNFHADINTLPTATNPLSGLANHPRGKSAVFPHMRLRRASMPRMRGEDPVIHTTTGACTVPNYIDKKAGAKALFHHVIGATLVETDADGVSFLRPINAVDSDGSFYDVHPRDGRPILFAAGTWHEVEPDAAGARIPGLVPGDIHRAVSDPVVDRVVWGLGGREGRQRPLVDALRPGLQPLHDLIDFRWRNHHNRDGFSRMRAHHRGTSVRAEVEQAVAFVKGIRRRFCRTVMIESNHDTAISRWLLETDWKEDPENAEFYLELALAKARSERERGNGFNVTLHALEACGLTEEDARFVAEGESFVAQGIELGLHGHLSPNGARGSTNGLVRLSRKVVSAHTHAEEITDGLYRPGVCASLDMGYNERCPSSWTQSLVPIWPNGKRGMLTVVRGRWRALGRPRAA